MVGMSCIKSRKDYHLPRHFTVLFSLDNLGNCWHFIEIPPTYRLEAPDKLLPLDKVAISHPKKACIPSRPTVGMGEAFPKNFYGNINFHHSLHRCHVVCFREKFCPIVL